MTHPKTSTGTGSGTRAGTGVLRSDPLLLAADLVRASGVISLLVALTMGGVPAALFFLVLGGLMLLRVVGLPSALDLATGLFLVLAAWFAVLDHYVRHPWLDVPVHLVATGLVAVAVHAWLVQLGALHGPEERRLRRPWLGAMVTTAALGLALGVLWETGEWFGHTFLDQRIQTGYDDTVGDLVSGGVGALLAGWLMIRSSARDD